MSFKVRLCTSGREFTVEPGQSLLDAALSQGIVLPYACRNGGCGSCKARLLSGEVGYPGYGDRRPLGLSAADADAGQILPCIATARSDLEIEAREIHQAADIGPRTLTCQVWRLERLAPDVMRIYLRPPRTERLQFLAGQYLNIIMADGRRRAFSIANAPQDDKLVELHIRNVRSGEFTDYVFNGMKARDELLIEAPLGNFYLHEDSDRPIIFMAGGTGFAPVKGILEQAFAEGITRPMTLYWGARGRSDLYLDALPRTWEAAHPNFRYEPVLSDPLPDDAWTGRTGFVHVAVLDDHPDLSGFDVYASGPPVMVHAGEDVFCDRGLPREHYYSDAFEFARDRPKGSAQGS